MRFGDEELGGKHIDPANIRMQGEQQECAKLIGYGRKMLGGLKHRMQLGDLEVGKTSQSGTYKYIARLEELERWGRPVIDKRNILNLHDHPDTVDRTEYEVTVDWSIAVNSVKSAVEGGDLDSMHIRTEVGYNLVEEFPAEESQPPAEEEPLEEKTPLRRRRILGYIVQAFSSDPFNEDDPIDLFLTNPSGSTLNLQQMRVPNSTLEPKAYQGFPDNGAYYATVLDQPERQRIFSTQVHMATTYNLEGPIVVTPEPAPAGVEHFTWVNEYTSDTGSCGFHPWVGDLVWFTDSFWGYKYAYKVQAAIKPDVGAPYWQDVATIYVNSPGLIYSGGWKVHFSGMACDSNYPVIPDGVGSAIAGAYKSYIVDTQYAPVWNNAYKQTFDSYTRFYKDSSADAYDYTTCRVFEGQSSETGYMSVIRRADAAGFGLLGGFEMHKRTQFTIHGRAEFDYGSAAIFMFPDKEVKATYTYCDQIHDAVLPPTSNTYNVNIGSISAGEIDGSGTAY